MVSITISVPEEVIFLMRKFLEVNRMGLVSQRINEKAKQLAIKEELLKQLEKEREFNEWAVNFIRAGRK